jgi:hypothetical protein
LTKRLGSAKEKSDDDPLGDDEVADGDHLDDHELVEDGEDTALDECAPYSARMFDQRPERGEI